MFQAGYGAVAGRGGARPPTAARVSRGLNRAPTEGACQGGPAQATGHGARLLFTVLTVPQNLGYTGLRHTGKIILRLSRSGWS